LLVRLRDGAGLTYREISEFPLFSDLVYRSMSQLYLNAKKQLAEKQQEFAFLLSVPSIPKTGFYQAVFQMLGRKSAKPGGLSGSASSQVPMFAVFNRSILDI
jgi:hypothetical protein